MSGRIDLTMGFNTQKTAIKKDEGQGFRIYILGHFSAQPELAWEGLKIRKIDVDTFDQVMTQIKPSLEIRQGVTLQFESLEDFHPDVWLKKLPILADLLTLKRQLSNPATAAQAAAKIQAFLPSETQSDTSIQPQQVEESQEDMLERLLGKRPETPNKGTDSVTALIGRMVEPFVIKDAEPQHQALIKVIDATISQFLRTLLHRQDFQALEALWRASAALMNEESADRHSFFLVDIRRADLLAEQKKGKGSLEHKLLQHIQSCDGEQDVLLVGDYRFSDSAEDRDLLAFCARLADSCGAGFLGAADSVLIENTLFASPENILNWRQYLKQMSADRVALAYPRYLLRLPYGNKRDLIEALAFEECSAIPQADELLWGNPAFLCARVLMRVRQGQTTDEAGFFNDIPAFAFVQEGEQVLQPGAETILIEARANALVSQGITPLVAYRQRQGVRLLPIVALSEYS